MMVDMIRGGRDLEMMLSFAETNYHWPWTSHNSTAQNYQEYYDFHKLMR